MLPSSAETEHGRSRLTSRVEVSLVWLLGHASTLAPFLVFGLVLALSWGALRDIRVRDFRLALRTLDPLWLGSRGAPHRRQRRRDGSLRRDRVQPHALAAG